jgi:hypothetical protein
MATCKAVLVPESRIGDVERLLAEADDTDAISLSSGDEA